jgi:hypothetical protein
MALPGASIGAASVAGSPDHARPLPVPLGFEVAASNGYTVAVWGVPAYRGKPSAVVVSVESKHAYVAYFPKGDVTDSSIQASLGDIGEIDVHFQPSGQAKTEHPSCSPETVRFDSGFYEGTIRIDGEEGYTHLDATRAQGDVQFALDILCGLSGDEGSGPNVPGAELRAKSPSARNGASFGAFKNRPGARASFGATIDEEHDGIGIERSLTSMAGPGAFRYDPLLRTATVRPPAPFSGSATYRRDAAVTNRWGGTLAVDFPGHSDVDLTDPAMRVSIRRVVKSGADRHLFLRVK